MVYISWGSSIKYVRTEGGGVWANAYANILVSGWRHKNCVQGGGGGGSKILKILRTYFMDGPLHIHDLRYIHVV